MDYIAYSSEKDYLAMALPWLEQAVNHGKSNADSDVIQKYFELLEVRYQSDKAKYSESFINAYLELGDMVDARIAKADKYKEAYTITRNNLNALFINSGAADCSTLEGVFTTKVEENKLNDAELEKIINIFDKADCKESEIYFTASRYAHALNPVAKTAVGCARQAFKKEEYANAIKFYNEALELEQVDSLKYTYAIEKANALYKSKRYGEAKSAALQALSFDSKQGEPYMLLATIYVTTDPYPEDPILNKTKYWAAVDKLQTAKSVEPELAEKANTLINSYRKFYPTKEEVFFKPELAPGADFTVGGIINESVRCRD
jgi:tetratricopeptide (TPR) repeat protein